MRVPAAVWIALLALPVLAAERWKLVYSYEPADNSEFEIRDFAFGSADHGMAVGMLSGGKGRPRPYAVITTDGGRTWQPRSMPDQPGSLYLLDGSNGWLVGRKGIWRTPDFGSTWQKAGEAKNALRVWFRNENVGYAVGAEKSVYETSDGGASWKPLPAAAEPRTTPANTVYYNVAFGRPADGLIVGWSKPPRTGSRVPDWVDPEARPREFPSVLVLLQTRDGGKQWQASVSSFFGRFTRIRLAPDGRGLGLVEFFDRFDYTSEVYRVDLQTGKSQRAFRRKDRMVTDVAFGAGGPAYVAAVEPTGELARSPVPGKLKLLKSDDLEIWTEMKVDYRAVARRAVLAAPTAGKAWVATDTGMILALTEE